MNERIKELMEQAGLHDFVVESMGIDEEMEKFARLIVQECSGKVDWILAEGGKTQGDLIKEHFGVES